MLMTQQVSIESTAQSTATGGKVYLHVESSVNGQKKELTSTQPGEIKITFKENQFQTEVKTETAAQSNSPKIKTSTATNSSNFFQNFFSRLQNFLNQFFK